MKYDLETLIDELAAAERSGVFAKTSQPIIMTKVTNPRSHRRFLLVSPRWAVAAALLMAAGVWTMMFRSNLSDVRQRARTDQIARTLDLSTALASCMAGPDGSIGSACGRGDFDGDGDVDLSDYGFHQRNPAGTTR